MIPSLTAELAFQRTQLLGMCRMLINQHIKHIVDNQSCGCAIGQSGHIYANNGISCETSNRTPGYN